MTSNIASIRKSMSWVHTWLGIGLGSILYAIFWTGSLTVFDKEIDQWMKPELRIAYHQNSALDPIVNDFLRSKNVKLGSSIWIATPTPRVPIIKIFYVDSNGLDKEVKIDPTTGAVLDETDSEGGEFFFHFHYMLFRSFFHSISSRFMYVIS